MARIADERGQAAVELCALLPVVAALVLGAWQVVLWGRAEWAASAAARAAARADAVGGDARAAARRVLPPPLAADVQVHSRTRGDVTVALPVPLVVGHGRLLTLHAGARFAPQTP